MVRKTFIEASRLAWQSPQNDDGTMPSMALPAVLVAGALQRIADSLERLELGIRLLRQDIGSGLTGDRRRAEERVRRQLAGIRRMGVTDGPRLLPDFVGPPALRRPLADVAWPVRCRKVFNRLGLRTFGELAAKGEIPLIEIRGFGRTSRDEVREKLAGQGMAFAEDGAY